MNIFTAGLLKLLAIIAVIIAFYLVFRKPKDKNKIKFKRQENLGL